MQDNYLYCIGHAGEKAPSRQGPQTYAGYCSECDVYPTTSGCHQDFGFDLPLVPHHTPLDWVELTGLHYWLRWLNLMYCSARWPSL